MPRKIQIVHEQNSDTYTLASVMYDDKGDWFALQDLCELPDEIAEALAEPVLETTQEDETED